MGKTYLLDTNTVVYFLDSQLPEKSLDFIENALDETGSFIFIISKIELLGWSTPSTEALNLVERFVSDCFVLPLTDNVVDKAIEIRRAHKIKLPDAVIAATAIVNQYTLISRNDEDFRKVEGLEYLNPFKDI